MKKLNLLFLIFGLYCIAFNTIKLINKPKKIELYGCSNKLNGEDIFLLYENGIIMKDTCTKHLIPM